MKRLMVLGLVLTFAWLLAFAGIVFAGLSEANPLAPLNMTLNEWGDFLAGMSAPIALLWLVIGYFQHGQELKLNTRALMAQEEELRRQVEETARLVESSSRQAAAAELLVVTTERHQKEEARRAVQKVQPKFAVATARGGAEGIIIKIENIGGAASEMDFVQGVPGIKSWGGPRTFGPGATGQLKISEQVEYPAQFGFTYKDEFNVLRVVGLALEEGNRIVEVQSATQN